LRWREGRVGLGGEAEVPIPVVFGVGRRGLGGGGDDGVVGAVVAEEARVKEAVTKRLVRELRGVEVGEGRQVVGVAQQRWEGRLLKDVDGALGWWRQGRLEAVGVVEGVGVAEVVEQELVIDVVEVVEWGVLAAHQAA
jgi:hypothetical protein